MKNRISYRFKTQKELEAEFGAEWRTDVPYSWPQEMDRLFGFPVSAADYNLSGLMYPISKSITPSPKKSYHLKGKGPFVSISRAMLTSEPLPTPESDRKNLQSPAVVETKKTFMPSKIERRGTGTEVHHISAMVTVWRNPKTSFAGLRGPFIQLADSRIFSPEAALAMAKDIETAVEYMKVIEIKPKPVFLSRTERKCKGCGKSRRCYKRVDGYFCSTCNKGDRP